MERVLFKLFLGLLLLSACKSDPILDPDPIDNGDSSGNTEISVKKYLVREYHPFETDTLAAVRAIVWNDDYSRILHVTTNRHTPYQVDFDFQYHAADSFQVHLSKPADGWSMVLFTDYACHLDNEGRIATIDYYYNLNYQFTEQYQYDESSHLVQVTQRMNDSVVGGSRFTWEGGNVTEEYSVMSGELSQRYLGFRENSIHPHSTLPYLLRCGDTYSFLYITQPLWKNWPDNGTDFVCECDEDGYVICQYRLDENGEKKAVTYYEYGY